jgi:hypothetical protein
LLRQRNGDMNRSMSMSLSGSEEYKKIRDMEARELFRSSQNTLFQEERMEVQNVSSHFNMASAPVLLPAYVCREILVYFNRFTSKLFLFQAARERRVAMQKLREANTGLANKRRVETTNR